MEIATSCVQILVFLHAVYSQLNSNSAEAKRLIDRVIVFKDPLDALIQQQLQLGGCTYQTRQHGLNNLLSLLNDIKIFIAKYSEPTYWRFATKVAFRNSNAAELAFFNSRISSCSGDLQFGLLVDNESKRREQDLDDAKNAFNALLDQNVKEAATKEALDQIALDIASYQQSVVEMLRVHSYPPLVQAEQEALSIDSERMTAMTNQRLDELFRLLQRVEAEQHLILNILEERNHTQERESRRAAMLRDLTKSVLDISRGALIGSGSFGQVFKVSICSPSTHLYHFSSFFYSK